MRKKIFIIAAMLVFIFIAGGWSLVLADTQSQQVRTASDQGELLRFHVIANSDSPYDQEVKIKVRDAVLAYLAPKMKGLDSSGKTREVIENNRTNIITVANQVLAMYGANYKAGMEIGQFEFPVKLYGTVVVPAGKYEAVRITLGQASGKNWWCVLFPPLCFIDINSSIATQQDADSLSKARESGVEKKIELRWMLAEYWNKR
jgi:stage II sporulation protein R